MKFEIGDETDQMLVIALVHEFIRCQESFEEFAKLATNLIMLGHDRRAAFRTYNAYALFIHHLYEFLIGAIKRDRRDTVNISAVDAEHSIQREAQRALTQRREAIIGGWAPSWENALSAYPEFAPPEFAKEFRRYRNVTLGHVSIERRNLSLSHFFDRYHGLLYMIYRDSHFAWHAEVLEFPDLKEITDFRFEVERSGAMPST